jgi:hypothetical protein
VIHHHGLEGNGMPLEDRINGKGETIFETFERGTQVGFAIRS